MKKLPIGLLILGLFLCACRVSLLGSTPTPDLPAQPSPAQIANPASQNCIQQGGTLTIETRGDGGQYGVCVFEDNYQCEEWALLNGACPVGGVKVTGYTTPAATYCAISGGTYTAAGQGSDGTEQGTCTFSDGSVCSAWDYYNGLCNPGDNLLAPTPSGTIQPLSMEVCDGQAQAMARALDVLEVTQTTAPLSDPVTGASGTGCAAMANGTGAQFQSPDGVVADLGDMLVSQGYSEDMLLAAGGPTGSGAGYRKDDQICVAAALWTPAESANCPQDQPISACAVTPEQQLYTISLNCGVESAPLETTPSSGMANPASENCLKNGGTLSIETRGDGGQYGICYFEDNRQCEEWALLRGDCPVGGLKITGYITPAAQYCAITGGTYTITGESNTDTEQGTCTFKNGAVCDAWDYYNGACSPDTPAASAQPSTPVETGGPAVQLVFDSNREGDYRDIYLLSLEGSPVKRLTQGEADNIAGPFSPDGQRIVYTSFGLTNSTLAMMNADGSGGSVIDQVAGSDEGFPDWSPDGARIAFTSRRDGDNEIYVINADGTNPVRLTDNPGDDFAPAWSPDGAQIVFVSDRDQSAGIYDLYIMNADGSGVTRLTNDPAIDYSPDWSPDGQAIIFRSHHDGPADIYRIDLDGSGLTDLTNNPADDWSPAWSPDGKYIAFQTDRDGNWEIYVMAADGSQQVNLTNDPADDQMPFWRP